MKFGTQVNNNESTMKFEDLSEILKLSTLFILVSQKNSHTLQIFTLITKYQPKSSNLEMIW